MSSNNDERIQWISSGEHSHTHTHNTPIIVTGTQLSFSWTLQVKCCTHRHSKHILFTLIYEPSTFLPVYWFPSWIYTYYVELCFRNLTIRLYVLRIRIPDTWQNSVCRYALFIKLIYENGWVRQNEWRERDVCKGFVYCILMVFTLLTCSSA